MRRDRRDGRRRSGCVGPARVPPERGRKRRLEATLTIGAVNSVVNSAEVLSQLGDGGEEPAAIHRRLREQGLVGGLFEVAPLNEDGCVVIARLRARTRAQGLSLGDRACLATGLRLGRPVITTDRVWGPIDAGVSVRLIRP